MGFPNIRGDSFYYDLLQQRNLGRAACYDYEVHWLVLINDNINIRGM